MESEIFSWFAPAAMFAAATWPFVDGWREQRARTRELWRRAEARQNHTRRLFPALAEAPPPPFKGTAAVPVQLPLDMLLFSDQTALMTCEVVLDGDCVQGVFTMDLADETGRVPNTLAQLETIARKHPHQEWLVQLTAPLQSLVYQRHGPGQWNLVRTGQGMF